MAKSSFSLAGACVLLAASLTLAGEPSRVSFDDDVLPLLKARCVKCHGPVKREGGLNLAAPRSIARGGETGPAVDRKQTLQ
ncbi:MAG TPA: c-type cytochrome domain-containing protein, partial [Pirellulales bacterium]|nr:c-type cytochrome domain-containing protein [Pirellulales bacterium]